MVDGPLYQYELVAWPIHQEEKLWHLPLAGLRERVVVVATAPERAQDPR